MPIFFYLKTNNYYIFYSKLVNTGMDLGIRHISRSYMRFLIVYSVVSAKADASVLKDAKVVFVVGEYMTVFCTVMMFWGIGRGGV